MADRIWGPTLAIMARRPVAGAVKTRLAQRIGAMEALRFYRTVSDDLLRRVQQDKRWRTVLAVTPESALGAGHWPHAIRRIPQGRGDLGARLQRIFDVLPPGPAVVVGSDIPNIRADDISRAFALLGFYEAVFGRAEDGGYWLVGLKRRSKRLSPFADVRWSSEHALADSIRNLRGARIGFVRTLFDVDTREDWLRWRQGIRQA